MKLNYRGDRTEAIGQLMGPDLYGAIYQATEATYNPDTDRTALTLRPFKDFAAVRQYLNSEVVGS